MPKAEAGRRSARQSNIELLRILAMLAIILNHSVVHGHVRFAADTLSVNRLWFQLIQIPGFPGVDAFVIISGYFLISARSVKSSRILKLWAQILFYSLLFFALPLAFGATGFSLRELAGRLLPVTSCHWWFASTYFVLYLLSPFLNQLLNAFDRRQFLGFLGLFFLLWCLIPTVEGNLLQSFAMFQDNHLMWFIFLYAVGAFLRRYPPRTSLSGGKLIGLSLLCMLLVFLSSIVLALLGTKKALFAQHALFLADLQMLPSLAAAVLLFLGFSRLELGSSRLINLVSSAVFGVYLIHDDSLVRPFLWHTLFRLADFADSPVFIPRSLLVVAAVFIACTLIELARLYLVEKPCLPLIERIGARLDRAGEALLDRCFGKE